VVQLRKSHNRVWSDARSFVSHSHITKTSHPAPVSAASALESRSTLRANFGFQYPSFELGGRSLPASWVLMPKTAVHKDDLTAAGENQIRLTWQVFSV